jgi:hypothetical protein
VAKSVQLKWAIWCYLFVTWSAVCYAAESTALSQGLSSIPVRDVGVVLVLSVVGGIAGTLVKLTKRDTVVKHLSLEIAKDFMASLVVGLLTFFFTSWWEGVSYWLQAGLIMLAGYGGSKVLDLLLDEGGIPWLRAFMGRLFGKPMDPPVVAPPKEETPP